MRVIVCIPHRLWFSRCNWRDSMLLWKHPLLPRQQVVAGSLGTYFNRYISSDTLTRLFPSRADITFCIKVHSAQI